MAGTILLGALFYLWRSGTAARAAGVGAILFASIASAQSTAPVSQQVRLNAAPVVWIPGGSVLRGSTEEAVLAARDLCRVTSGDVFLCPPTVFFDEIPRRRIYVTRFGIDRTEVTLRAWGQCVAAGKCVPPKVREGDVRVGLPDHPVSGVTWKQASAYCAFRGGRLPSETEWERAARGSDSRTFPWGEHYNPNLANHGKGKSDPDASDGFRHASPVGAFPDGASPFGVLDLAGNVWEWTLDTYDRDSYQSSLAVDPVRQSNNSSLRVVRGGSWRYPSFALRVSHRGWVSESGAWPDVGFRCAYEWPT